MLFELPGAKQIASCHLTHLTRILSTASKGRYDRSKAVEFRDAAKRSIGSVMPAKSLELQHTIRLIRELDTEIAEIETSLKQMMDEIDSPILTIPGISYRRGAMILAEIGDFSRFASPDKLLAYAGLSPSTYQSGKLDNAYAHMENAALVIFDTLSITPPGMSAFGTTPSPFTSPRNGLRVSITTSLSLTQKRS